MRRIFPLLAPLLLFGLPWRAAAAEHAAGAVVARLHESLVQVMRQAAELGFQGRVKVLAPVIEDSFDFPTIARIVTGRYWAGMSEAERKTFLESFTRLSTATYASRFDSYSGESFRLVGEEAQKDNVLVRSELVKADGTVVKLDYVLRPAPEHRWLIVNVIADGVSDLSLKRADYTSILKNEGYAALIARLNAKIGEYEASAGQAQE